MTEDLTFVQKLACPRHKLPLDEELICKACGTAYPTVHGVPVLIDDENSVFSAADYVTRDSAYGGASDYGGHLDAQRGPRYWYRRAIYSLKESSAPTRDFDASAAVEVLRLANPDCEFLVIGAGDTTLSGRVCYTDVAFGKNVHVIADAHDLPFLSGSFDACVVCAVLEHVVDPHRCVEEIVRVLRPGGHVYAETPFMQPVHMRQHDFTRFTYLGHRRLFRWFDDVRSGVVGGPGTSAAQMMRYALISSVASSSAKRWLRLAGLLATYPMRWLDHLSRNHLGAYDSASAFYFFGRLREAPLNDREILKMFRGD